jgi:predicted permease
VHRQVERARVVWFEHAVQDVKYACRQLLRAHGFAAVALVSVTFGVGVNTAMLGLADAVLFRSLPVDDPEELVFVSTTGPRRGLGVPPYPWLERMRTDAQSFDELAAFATDELRISVDARAEQVLGQVVSGSYFDVLGLEPAAGRLLTPADERLEPPIAVIGYSYWQRRFGGAPDAVGRSVQFGGRIHTIVGVTPPAFSGLNPGRDVDLTLPITAAPGLVANTRVFGTFRVIARLGDGVELEQAAAESRVVSSAFVAAGGLPADAGDSIDAVELSRAANGLDGLRSRFSASLYVLVSLSAVVLIAACVNLGNLLLARGARRSRELAIRAATGASYGRLVRQLLTETLLLFLIAGAVGSFVAYSITRAIASYFSIGRTPIVLSVGFDWRFVSLAAGVALTAGLVTGLWPAVRALRLDPQVALKDRAEEGSSRLRVASRALLAGQVALALVALVMASLFMRTTANLRAVETGFTSDGVLTLSVEADFPGDTAATDLMQFWTRTLQAVRALPDVRSASMSVLTPLSGRDSVQAVAVRGLPPPIEGNRTIRFNPVSDDYFKTFGMRLISGRVVTLADTAVSQKVVVVNAAAAALFGGREPIGEVLELGESGSFTVVGVVENHKHLSLRETDAAFAFVPLTQASADVSRVTLSARTNGPTAVVARAVTREVQNVRADALVSDVVDVVEQVEATTVSERLMAALTTLFSGLVLALAAVGLYGVLSYSVVQRQAETGLRLALGARPLQVALEIVRSVLPPIAIGVGIGVAVALAISPLARRLLFGVDMRDALGYSVATSVVTGVALLAVVLPACRAAKTSPIVALKAE